MEVLKHKFWSKVKKTKGCWIWIGSKDKDGYGFISYKQKTFKAHRISWEFHYGKIPKSFKTKHGTCVLHKCDNPSCIKPKHLFLGTQLDNIKDRTKKGRTSTKSEHKLGELNGCSKLTEKQILDIRSRKYYWGLQQDLSKEFKVKQSWISSIINRNAWRHI